MTKNLSGGNYRHRLLKNWLEGKRCKTSLWGENDGKGCEIHFVDCFYSSR